MAVKYVIQARENSERFPGKCFAIINGKWIIDYIIDACKGSKHYTLGSIVFVIPEQDKKLRDILQDFDIYASTDDNCRIGYLQIGNPDDILVRLTADSPLIESREIDYNIDKILCGFEYSSNEITSFGNCCEAFAKDALIKYTDETDNIHVTPNIRNYAFRWIPSLMTDYPESIEHIERYLNV